MKPDNKRSARMRTLIGIVTIIWTLSPEPRQSAAIYCQKEREENKMDKNKIPYKIYLEEHEMPKQWYNVRADMKKKPAPILNPQTLQPITVEELSGIFCEELAKQELDDTTAYFDIPEEIRNFYKMYRPSPLVRAYCLEEKLGTPAHIYYKFEGNNTSGSHKLNSAIAQAYYAKKQGLKGVTTETGAGQWGTALSMACSYFDMDCQVYMVKCSYEMKPHRREVMRTYGAKVTPSPSMETGRSSFGKCPAMAPAQLYTPAKSPSYPNLCLVPTTHSVIFAGLKRHSPMSYPYCAGGSEQQFMITGILSAGFPSKIFLRASLFPIIMFLPPLHLIYFTISRNFLPSIGSPGEKIIN